LAVIFYSAPQMMLGRGTLLLTLALTLLVMVYWRLWVWWVNRNPRFAERILILGTDENAVMLAREVLSRKGSGYEVVGFVGDEPGLIGKSLINPSVVGLFSELEEIVGRYKANRVVVAASDRRKRLPMAALMALKLCREVAIEESASFYERLTGKISTEMLRPSWLVFSSETSLQRIYTRTTRVLDLVLAITILIAVAPLMLVVTLAIKLDSVGPVLYTQERVGLNRRVFRIVKFRSMQTDAEKDGAVWASERDPRITAVGRVIRKTRIDELPQLINVILGEMSLIGP